MRIQAAIALAPLTALAACGGAEEEVATDVETGAEYDSSSGAPVPGQAEADSSTDDDGELGSDRAMQGRWFADRMAGMDAALFGPPESDARFSVRCDEAAGELILTRSERARTGSVEMRLMAEGVSRTIRATSTPEPVPTVTGRLAANDRFTALLAGTDDPIAVVIGDGAPYRMPAAEALRDVVAGCG